VTLPGIRSRGGRAPAGKVVRDVVRHLAVGEEVHPLDRG
jgi:hypothetical protein